MDIDTARALAKLYASKFIARPDIRAIQTSDGEYRPQRRCSCGKHWPCPNSYDGQHTQVQYGFDMQALLDHITGQQTYGHYMMSPTNQVKFFALDIDLKKTGRLPSNKFGMEYMGWQEANPRELWMSHKQGAPREIMKLQLKIAANRLARFVTDILEIPVAVSYSGSKGVHVYGFTGLVPAERARKGALIVLDAAGFKVSQGKNFFECDQDQGDDIYSLSTLNVEVYPKQESLGQDQLGNLLRLPLGRNLKSPKDPCFFLDMRDALTDFKPMDPVEALTTTNYWRHQGE